MTPIFALMLAASVEKTFVDYSASAPAGWTRRAQNLLAEGANEINRRRMEFRPAKATGTRGEASISAISYRSRKPFQEAVDSEIVTARHFGKLGAPVRVAAKRTADGRPVQIYVFPKGIGDGYGRLGVVQMPGGYVVVHLVAPSGAGRRIGNPAFDAVIGSLRYVP